MSIAYLIAIAAAPLPSNTPEDVAIQAVHNFGACVVARTPEGAREALALDYGTPDYEKRMRRYIQGHDYCIPFNGRMSSAGVLFAGSMAEALLKSEVKPAGQLAQRIAYDPQREDIRARSPLEAMALCTVLNAPGVAAKIFDTEPATPEEANAMKPLGNVLPQCLRKDMQLTLNKPALRSLLALAAWRIANAPRKLESAIRAQPEASH
jgi:hypothetical protein